MEAIRARREADGQSVRSVVYAPESIEGGPWALLAYFH